MSQKKTVWFTVEEGETTEHCLIRMEKAGYKPTGRKEEPLFQEINGEMIPIKQVIKFKGSLNIN